MMVCDNRCCDQTMCYHCFHSYASDKLTLQRADTEPAGYEIVRRSAPVFRCDVCREIQPKAGFPPSPKRLDRCKDVISCAFCDQSFRMRDLIVHEEKYHRRSDMVYCPSCETLVLDDQQSFRDHLEKKCTELVCPLDCSADKLSAGTIVSHLKNHHNRELLMQSVDCALHTMITSYDKKEISASASSALPVVLSALHDLLLKAPEPFSDNDHDTVNSLIYEMGQIEQSHQPEPDINQIIEALDAEEEIQKSRNIRKRKRRIICDDDESNEN